MATIASLNVNLGMNTAAFDAKSKKIKGQVSELAASNGLGKLFGAGANFGAGLATVNALTTGAERLASALANTAAEVIENIDSHADLANQIGLSVENLSRLQYAARHGDVEIEALNSGLEKLGVNLGKAASKGGDNAFAKLGLDANKLAGMDRGEAFIQIADAISKIPTPAGQAAAANEAFGRSGSKLLPIFQGGADAIREFARESDALGNTITKLDAAKIGQIDASFKRLADTYKVLKQNTVLELAPAIGVSSHALEQLQKDVMKTDGIVGNFVNGYIKAFGTVVTGGLMDENGERFYEKWDRLTKAWEKTAKVQAGIAAKGQGNREAIQHVEEQAEAHEKLKEQLEEELALFGKIGREREIAKLGVDGEQLAVLENLDKQLKLQDEFADAAERRQAIIESAMSVEESHAARIAEIRKELNNPLIWVDEEETAKLEGVIDKLEAAEANRKKMELDANPLARVGEGSKTPMEEMEARLKELDDALFGGFIDEDHFALERLKAAKDFAATERVAQDTGPQRPGALEQGTAAAFSASFGAQAKPLDKIAKIEADMLVVMRRIDEKLPVVVAGKL